MPKNLCAHTHMETHTYKHTHPHGTCTLSSRQQDPVSNQDRAWSRSMLRANDLRHMSSPCGFKTKACQEHSALAGQPAPYFAFPHMQQATQSSKLKTTPIINCVVLVGCVPFCSIPLHTAAPISAAAADLPARAPQHPEDRVQSHYQQWEKLLGHGWQKKIRRTSRSRITRISALVSLKQVTGQ